MKCLICKREMLAGTDSEDCGGDCLRCMAESGDPDCASKLITIRQADSEQSDPICNYGPSDVKGRIEY